MVNYKLVIKKIFSKVMPSSFIRYIEQSYLINHPYYSYQNISFSQEGEDLVLERFLEQSGPAFYVDIGAHHPIRFSNTYKFYLQGWRGINIDAMPGSMKLFNELRPNDINLEVPIAEKSETLAYYNFKETAFNTLSKENADVVLLNNKSTLVDSIKLQTIRLDQILNQYIDRFNKITFMSIDVEGLDLSVLRSNNWTLFRPIYIMIETKTILITDLEEDATHQFLTNLSYTLVAKTCNTVIYKSII